MVQISLFLLFSNNAPITRQAHRRVRLQQPVGPGVQVLTVAEIRAGSPVWQASIARRRVESDVAAAGRPDGRRVYGARQG